MTSADDGMPPRMLTCVETKVRDTRFSRAAGGAFPSSLPKVRIDGSTEETWNSCFVRLMRQ